MIVHVQVASAELDGQRWYTVAAGPNLRLADWLARTLEVEGTARYDQCPQCLAIQRIDPQQVIGMIAGDPQQQAVAHGHDLRRLSR